jgi:hypothetical protein
MMQQVQQVQQMAASFHIGGLSCIKQQAQASSRKNCSAEVAGLRPPAHLWVV